MTGEEFEKLTVTGVLPPVNGSREGGEVVNCPPVTFEPAKPSEGLWGLLRRLLIWFAR